LPDDTNEHLRVQHLTGDLRGRSVRGAFSILVFQTIQLALGLVSTATLARLLAPSDFGLIAMATAVSGFLSLFLELGLGAAAVQRSDLSQSQITRCSGSTLHSGSSSQRSWLLPRRWSSGSTRSPSCSA